MADWIETFKGVIDAREYDPNAHMNTQAYVSRLDQATWFLLAQVGLTPRTVAFSSRTGRSAEPGSTAKNNSPSTPCAVTYQRELS